MFKYLLLLLTMSSPCWAMTFPLPESGDVVGHVEQGKARHDETLMDIGRRYNIGLQQLQEANPQIDPKQKLHAGVNVVIPNQYILPENSERQGLVINLAEQRLYFFPKNKNEVIIEPVGIGREGKWQTPIGLTKITKKQIDPPWHPTNNVRQEAAKHGTPIPSVFPAGPNNPLGKYVLRLGWATYLIHGTNDPETVGGRVSAGCIRLLPDAIAKLFDDIEVGMPVRVINQPYKIGWLDNQLYLEAHQLLSENQPLLPATKAALVSTIMAKLTQVKALINWREVKQAVESGAGLPTKIANKYSE